MPSQTSQELRAELVNTFFGIDPVSLLVDTVTVSRGGTLTRSGAGKTPISYRIKGGKPARAEVSRVFGLTDLVAIAPSMADGHEHPLVTALQRRAAERRRARDEDARRTAKTMVTNDAERYPDHRVLSQHEHSQASGNLTAEGVRPLAARAIAAAGRRSPDKELAHGRHDGTTND